jgi:hypothetical protein
MAAAAVIGDGAIPVNGYSSPHQGVHEVPGRRV